MAPARSEVNPSNLPPAEVRLLDGECETFYNVNGLRLCCREWGNNNAPAIVLLHGLRGFSGTWRGLAAELQKDYRLIAIDQRGRGNSDWDAERNYYTDAYVADLEAIVDRLGLGRFILLGHSMGGTAAYVYAARFPERLLGLVIEDIAPGSSVTGQGAARIIAEMASLPDSFGSWAEARAYWRMKRQSVGAEAIEQRLAESLRQAEDGSIVWRYDAAGIKATRLHPDPTRIVDLWPVIDRLNLPVLVIRGEKSDFCPAATVAEMIARNPRISEAPVKGASHYVHDDAPQEFLNHLRQFLQHLSVAR